MRAAVRIGKDAIAGAGPLIHTAVTPQLHPVKAKRLLMDTH